MRLKKMVLVFIVFLFSCGDKNQKRAEIIPPDKMQLVLFDILRADVFVFEYIKKDSAKKLEIESVKLQQQIFTAHKISKAAFYKSYDFYKAHPDLMQPILDSMISRATRDKYMNTKSGSIGNKVMPVEYDIKSIMFNDTTFNKNPVTKSRLLNDTLFNTRPLIKKRLVKDLPFNKKVMKKNRLFNYKLNTQQHE
jgi:hypothetical protein